MLKRACSALAAAFLAAFFFITPLVLKFHVYKPSSIKLALGDIVSVENQISTVWCQAVELSSDSDFQSFLYETEPIVVMDDFQRTVSTHKIAIPDKSQEYWRFHLLKGSQVNISSCVRLFAGDLTVVKEYHGLRRCLKEYRRHFEIEDISGEDSQSQSESDDETSSISSSQGAVSNETGLSYACKNALHHVTIPSSYKCNALLGATQREHVLSHEIEETDYYYYIFASDTYLDIIPNEFSIQFKLDRTHYDYSLSSSNCSNSDMCQMSIPFSSDPKIVVHLAGANGTLKQEELKITCMPREWLFFLFYTGFFITIFLCAFQKE